MVRLPGFCASRLILFLSLIGLSLGPAQAHLIGGSQILSFSDVDTLSGWLGEGPLQLKNIFSTDNDGTNTPADFHAACDGMGRTFSIYSVVKDNSSYIIGGYNPQSWSTAGSNITWPLEQRTAFVFNLTAGLYQGQRTDDAGSVQTVNREDLWPHFGNRDLNGLTDEDNPMPYYLTSTSYGPGPTYKNNLFGEDRDSYFTTNRLEVFIISTSAVPEPSIGLLLLVGIIPLGLIYRRRRRSMAVN